MLDFSIPQPTSPFVDKNGLVNLQWYLFLNNLFQVSSPVGVIPVTSGGTGLTSGVSGGILGFTGTTTLSSSLLLGSNEIVFGGGAGATPSTPLGLGTAVTLLHGNAGGTPTWGTVSLSTDVSGTLPVGSGGLGIATGTSGGIPAFTGTTTISSSTLLGANAIVVGGGAGVAPSTLVSLGTSSTVLHGNASGNPSFAVVTPADASGNTSGSGNFALVNTPTFTTPVLGAATATSINFGGDTLNTVSSGTWTPADNSGASLTFTVDSCEWVKIGVWVQATFKITFPVTVSGATNSISGLPFTARNTTSNVFSSPVISTLAAVYYYEVTPNTQIFAFGLSGAAAATNATFSGQTLRGCISYRATS